MKRSLLLLLALLCISCGSSDDASFSGTWDGELTLIGNDCPFSAPENQSSIFPIVVSQIYEDQLQVAAANGQSGAGTTTSNSFSVENSIFGVNIANTTPFNACKLSYSFGLFSADSSSAQSELVLNYTNCSDTSNGATGQSCAIAYSGTASKR